MILNNLKETYDLNLENRVEEIKVTVKDEGNYIINLPKATLSTKVIQLKCVDSVDNFNIDIILHDKKVTMTRPVSSVRFESRGDKWSMRSGSSIQITK